MTFTARAPLRIDFGGGWTDVPIFAEAEGGAVLNAAINVYVTGTARGAESNPGPLGRIKGTDANIVSYKLKAPAGAGLGASAAQTLTWLALVTTLIDTPRERRDLAERAWQVENALGILGGKQDQYASAVGGINFMTFGAQSEVEQLNLDLGVIDALESRLALFYSGARRMSGDVHEGVWGRYRAGEPEVVDALQTMRQIAHDQRAALCAGDLESFAELINKNWECQKRLHPTVTNPRLDGFVGVARDAGALAVKATGAGGGGCLLTLAERGAEHGLVDAMREAGAALVPFRFDWHGVFVTKT